LPHKFANSPLQLIIKSIQVKKHDDSYYQHHRAHAGQGRDTFRRRRKDGSENGFKGDPKDQHNFDGAPKKAKGKESTVPPWVTTGSELDGPPSDDQDGTLTEDSSATKCTTRKATKHVIKDKKVKKMRLLQAQKEEEERLWDKYSTQEDGSNQTFIAACTIAGAGRDARQQCRCMYGYRKLMI
jgi:hypothetical protein